VAAPRLLTAVLLAGMFVVAGTTVSRNFLWQDNVRLFEDAARKAPDFPFVKATLASLLMEAGRKEEAASIIRTNVAPEGLRNADFLDLQRAQLLYENGRVADARTMILAKRRKGKQLYYKFQELLLSVDGALLGAQPDLAPRELVEEYLALHHELYTVYREPFYLYRLGQFYLRLGDRESARKYFHQSAAEAPPGAHYLASARILADRLTSP
jgi:tetratricopeptide (TPR) repeat protein